MPDLLRALVFRRLVAALVLAAFVPVGSAVAACIAACPLLRAPAAAQASPGRPASAPAAHGHALPDGTMHAAAPTAHAVHGDLHLSHGGPCHLAAVPALVHEPQHALPAPPLPSWSRGGPSPYTSFAGPPPEHRPRA